MEVSLLAECIIIEVDPLPTIYFILPRFYSSIRNLIHNDKVTSGYQAIVLCYFPP